MIIKAKPLPFIFIRWGASLLAWFYRRRFNKVLVNDIDIKPGHSYLLMCNHFGFLDSFFSYYTCLQLINKRQRIKGIYNMSLKKQMEKKPWLRYTGSFSVDPRTRSISESLDYAAEILNEPGNVLIYYPQGNLESSHIRTIEFKDGVYEIMQRTAGNCQLIWSSTILEYFESVKPSAYINLLDCGANRNFDFEVLKRQVNEFHLRAIKKNFRFTAEDSI